MKTPKRAARVGSFENLESRVVMTSRAVIVNNDIHQFFANYAATVPGLVTNFETASRTAAQTGSAADKAAAAAAGAKIRDTLTTDVNGLGNNLLRDLGPSSANTIRLSVTGATAPTGVAFNPGGGNAGQGSLMNALLRIDGASPAALGGASGLNLAADLSIATSYAVSVGNRAFPLTPFGNFSVNYFNAVVPLANTLKADRTAASTPPTTAEQQQIAKDIAAIDAATVRQVNVLGNDLVNDLGRGFTGAVGMVITGVNSSNSVDFVPTNRAAFGSLMATLLEIDGNTALLLDPNIDVAIVTLYAFI